jgi:hypothetical protein
MCFINMHVIESVSSLRFLYCSTQCARGMAQVMIATFHGAQLNGASPERYRRS